MRRVRPDASDKELEAFAREVFRNVTLNYADIASLPHVDPKELLEKRLILHGIHENFMPAAASGQGRGADHLPLRKSRSWCFRDSSGWVSVRWH